MNTTLTLALAAFGVYAWIRNNRHPSKRVRRVTPVAVAASPRQPVTSGKRYTTLGQLAYNVAYLWRDVQTAWGDATRAARVEVAPAKQITQTADLVLDLAPWQATRQALATAHYVAPTDDDLLQSLFARSEPVPAMEPLPGTSEPEPVTDRQHKALERWVQGVPLSQNDVVALMGGNKAARIAQIKAIKTTGSEALQSVEPVTEPVEVV